MTAAEDPYLLEPALGGADTATRTRTVWQVRVEEGVTATDCGDVAGFPPAPSGARLTAVAPPSSTGNEPCVIPPGGGYHGLENRLYRVEIHSANGTGPTFKWSRDNGSSVFAVEELLNEDASGTDRIRLRRVGRDDTLALAGGQTIEVLDDDTVLAGGPGTIVEIDTIEEDRVLKLKAKVKGVSVARNARVRRWDGPPADVDAGTTHDLEAGIEVTFGGADYAPGDFWTFPARTAVGGIDELADAPPAGIRHHYAPLALVKWDTGGGGTTVEVEDCRTEFPSLTTLEAEDVGFSNDACTLTTTDGTPAETVQEALDVLCAGHGLKHHNAYLHGWGIVSGLKVVCEPDGPEQGARPPGLGDRPGRERHRDPGDRASVPRARREVRRRSGQRHQDPDEGDRGRLALVEPGPRNRRRALRGRAVQLGLEEGAERPAQQDAPHGVLRGLHRRRAPLLRGGADASPRGRRTIRPARSRSGSRRSPTSSCSVSTRRRGSTSF